MEVVNNTLWSEAAIRSRPIVGMIRNNWRRRHVTLHLGAEEDTLFMIDTTFDRKRMIISHEKIGMNERCAMDYWKHGNKVYVID